MKTVLITGGTGMVGRALTKAWRDKGYEVIVMGGGGIRDGGVGLSFAKRRLRGTCWATPISNSSRWPPMAAGAISRRRSMAPARD